MRAPRHTSAQDPQRLQSPGSPRTGRHRRPVIEVKGSLTLSAWFDGSAKTSSGAIILGAPQRIGVPGAGIAPGQCTARPDSTGGRSKQPNARTTGHLGAGHIPYAGRVGLKAGFCHPTLRDLGAFPRNAT